MANGYGWRAQVVVRPCFQAQRWSSPDSAETACRACRPRCPGSGGNSHGRKAFIQVRNVRALREIFSDLQMVPNPRPWSKRLLRALAQAGGIVAITLALDLPHAGHGVRRVEAQLAGCSDGLYRGVRAGAVASRPRRRTRTRSARGARFSITSGPTTTGSAWVTCAPGEADKAQAGDLRRRQFVHRRRWASSLRGELCGPDGVRRRQAEARRCGTSACCPSAPIIYYRKIKAAAEKLGLKPTRGLRLPRPLGHHG